MLLWSIWLLSVFSTSDDADTETKGSEMNLPSPSSYMCRNLPAWGVRVGPAACCQVWCLDGWSPWSGWRPAPAPPQPCRSEPTSQVCHSSWWAWPSRLRPWTPSPCRGCGCLGKHSTAGKQHTLSLSVTSVTGCRHHDAVMSVLIIINTPNTPWYTPPYSNWKKKNSFTFMNLSITNTKTSFPVFGTESNFVLQNDNIMSFKSNIVASIHVHFVIVGGCNAA